MFKEDSERARAPYGYIKNQPLQERQTARGRLPPWICPTYPAMKEIQARTVRSRT